jgi:hypothetical protein
MCLRFALPSSPFPIRPIHCLYTFLSYAVPLGLHLSDPEAPLCEDLAQKFRFIRAPETPTEAEERVQTFWLGYASERIHTFFTPFAMSMADEDINQVLPARKEDYEAGVRPLAGPSAARVFEFPC